MKSALDEQLLKNFWMFMKIQERPANHSEGIRFSMEIGNTIQVQLSEKSERIKAKFIGMDPGAYLIISVPNIVELKEQIFRGREVVLRYITGGTIFGFESNVIALNLQPVRPLFLTYPKRSSPVKSENTLDLIAHITLASSYPGSIARAMSPISVWAAASLSWTSRVNRGHLK